MRRARPLRATWIISPDVVSPIDSPRAAQREKKKSVTCAVRVSMGDARRRASRGVYRRAIEGTPLDRALGAISAHACIIIPAGRRRVVHHGSATAADSGEQHRDKYRNPASGLQLDGESEEGCSEAPTKERNARAAGDSPARLFWRVTSGASRR